MTFLANYLRPEGDPKIVSTGTSSLSSSDSLARALGWFSIGLGLAELLAPHKLTSALGMRGKEGLVRAYGAREIASGMLTLSLDKQAGLVSRVAGDGLDIATLLPALSHDNPKRENVGFALTMVVGITLLDIIAARATTNRHARPWATGAIRTYGDRSGFPGGVAAARGAAVKKLSDMRPSADSAQPSSTPRPV
ncbi:hypothetical protein [Rhizobium oryzicola]|uniref:Cyclase dehydrase n=1 Tax=Rhizobium oryzicola TaxID=1232668 RepID=A0ABT8SRF4_9HYPH|nr:hypothetical protein [Rhizobium oryzicola]MDO1580941.1 hypothetical protein [Rhizobium oryzicola]